METKNISVKVCGNPESNGGFTPLVLYNTPSFAIDNQFYVGFDDCSYFFSLKVEPTQTVYKLFKNRVRSYGAYREGSLIIAFSIPKGYRLDGGYTPYDVLTQLMEEFLKDCMTCKDTISETYEYNSGRVDQHVLDEIVKGFTISAAAIPYRPMTPSGKVGYIVRQEEEIMKFFKDTNYPELQEYSEVIVAKTAKNTNCVLISNLRIPRQIIYSLYVDGVLRRKVDNIDEVINITSGYPNDPCFEHKTVSFTVRDLVEHNRLEEGIELDSVEERVNIMTSNWKQPKVRKIRVRISPGEYEYEVLSTTDLLQITSPSGLVKLSSDFSFSLVGNEISNINKLNIKLRNETDFSISKCELTDKDELTVHVQKKPKIQVPLGGNSFNQTTTKDSPVSHVKMLFADDGMFANGDTSMLIKVLSMKSSRLTELLSTRVNFVKKIERKRSFYEGHLFVTKEYRDKYCLVELKTEKCTYRSINSVDFKKEELELQDFDFEAKPNSFLKKHAKLLVWIITCLLSLVLGSFIGYDIAGSGKKAETTEEQQVTRNDSGKSQNPDSTGEGTGDKEGHMAIAFFEKADKILSNDNSSLDFETCRGLHDSLLIYRAKQKNVVNDYKKAAQIITDYYRISKAINNHDYDSIVLFLNQYNEGNFHIWVSHRDCAAYICRGYQPNGRVWKNYTTNQITEAKEYFYDNEFKCFNELKGIKVTPSGNEVASAGIPRSAESISMEELPNDR